MPRAPPLPARPVAAQLTGKCGSVRVRLVPAPRGTGIVAAPGSKKMLQMAGLQDCYTSSTGHTKTLGNFIKAVFEALSKSYAFLAPELWKETRFSKPPQQEFTEYLAKVHKSGTVQKQAPM